MSGGHDGNGLSGSLADHVRRVCSTEVDPSVLHHHRKIEQVLAEPTGIGLIFTVMILSFRMIGLDKQCRPRSDCS